MARNREGSTPARRREFDRTCPKTQHFGKTDLAKYLMTWWKQPQVVSRGAQKNYASFMFSLRERMGEDWTPDKAFFQCAIAKAIFFKTTQSVVRRARLPSYGANIVTYTVASVSEKFADAVDLELIWKRQAISEEMESLLASWAPLIHAEIVQSAGSRNVTEWCKKDDCWAEIRSLHLPIPEALPPELKAAGEELLGDSTASDTQCDSVDECTSLDAPTWARIVAWATAAPGIDDYDKKVAHTLSGYAINGWLKAPSIKQAARGIRVIEAARQAGVC
jgi:hypothetical protein